MVDTVFVHGIEAKFLIGTEPGERLDPQTLLVDVDVECDCRPAGRSDRLADAVDYVRLVEVVRERAAASRFHLLEALAEDLAATLLAQLPGAGAVRLRIAKPEALAGIPSVGISIRRQRGPA
ncbi:MAG TPA: dihydroneopterin aldolase [Thermoanaerobaculaceae bacterium]|nr:dihydroneopterin aldolase [Thermoanaerobaculaceae bacterium]HRS17189.1 dihydroneopterin aldolase [Thermoanaerobaculaceae bacterium]